MGILNTIGNTIRDAAAGEPLIPDIKKKNKKASSEPGYPRFSVETLKSSLSKVGGLHSPTLFGVGISFKKPKTPGSAPVAGKDAPGGEEVVVTATPSKDFDVCLLAYSTNLPGASTIMADVRRQGFGPVERRVAGMSFPDVNITFLLDNNGRVLEFFSEWLKSMYSFNNLPSDAYVDPSYNGTLGQVGFYDDYVAKVEIIIYDQYSNKIAKYELIDAYPGQINQVDLSWRQTDEISELQTTFYYRHWNVEYYNPDSSSKGKGKRLNLLQFVNKLKGAVEIVKSFKKPRSVGDALNLLNNGQTLWKGTFGG